MGLGIPKETTTLNLSASCNSQEKPEKSQGGLLHLMEASEKVFHLEAFTSFSGTTATAVGFLSVNGHMQDMKYQGQEPSATDRLTRWDFNVGVTRDRISLSHILAKNPGLLKS